MLRPIYLPAPRLYASIMPDRESIFRLPNLVLDLAGLGETQRDTVLGGCQAMPSRLFELTEDPRTATQEIRPGSPDMAAYTTGMQDHCTPCRR